MLMVMTNDADDMKIVTFTTNGFIFWIHAPYIFSCNNAL